jgi:hypothetical protein
MTVISEPFPLIGTRDYVHSTTLLNFLDQFQPLGVPPAPIDLRLRKKLRPGGQVFIDQGVMPDAAATARVGERSFSFINAEAPVNTSFQPDRFDDFLSDITHVAGSTIIRCPSARNESAGNSVIWPRLIFATKLHLMSRHSHSGHERGGSNFLLTRISCRKPHPREVIEITTDIIVGDNWFRLCVTGANGLLGYGFVALVA